MYQRNILKSLNLWRTKQDRKPLILRGARQTGKTVAVGMFAKQFENYIYLNLERELERGVFEKHDSLEQSIHAIELATNKSVSAPGTLIFIDEIQNSEKAIRLLRFFYEERPELLVIAAGSLLEAVMKKEGFSFPVGRVEFLYMHPLTFDEFLTATGNDKMLGSLNEVDVTDAPSPMLHDVASKLFHQYALIGGMPAIVANFADNKSFKSASDLKEDLLTAIKDDVAKYSRLAETKYIRHVIEYAPFHCGERITYERFGQSEFKSREIKRAFETLEYSMVVQRVYGSSATLPPIEPNFRVAPKLIYLDSGLAAHKLGITEDVLSSSDLNDSFRGRIAEQVVGQSILAEDPHKLVTPCFWYRNAPGSTAETDYLIQENNKLIPIEVKSGKSGRLRSLHQFMANSDSNIAIRIYSGELGAENIDIGSRKFKLISMPFYLQFRMRELIRSSI